MNFALIMFVLLVITGVVTLAEMYFFRARREAAAAAAVASLEAQAGPAELPEEKEKLEVTRNEVRDSHLKQPWWIEYPVSFFPVILIVFVLRSFLVEPFKIPSGSMLPTLLIGRGGGWIKPGRRVVYRKETPMCNFHLTLMDRMGVPVENFGDASGHLDPASLS